MKRDSSALHHIHISLPIGGQSTQRHLGINHPLGYELALRIENLDAPADIFGDVNFSGRVDRDAARILEHPRPDALRAEAKQLGSEPVRFRFAAGTNRSRSGWRSGLAVANATFD